MIDISARLSFSQTPSSRAVLGSLWILLLVCLTSCDNKTQDSIEMCQGEVAKQFPEADFGRPFDLQHSVLQAVRTCMESHGMVLQPTAECHLTVVELNRFCYRPK